MAKLWHNRILATYLDGTLRRKYEDVPEKYKLEVKQLFRLDVEYNIISEEQYEDIIGEPY